MWSILLLSTLLVFVPSAVKADWSCSGDGYEMHTISSTDVICFKAFEHMQMNFKDATTHCADDGGTLLKITSRDLNTQVKRTLSRARMYWIGYYTNAILDQFSTYDPDANFPMTRSFPWAFFEPKNNNPDDRCMAIRGDSQGTWHSRPCDYKKFFICSHDANSAP